MKKTKGSSIHHKKVVAGLLATVLSLTLLSSTNVGSLSSKISADSTSYGYNGEDSGQNNQGENEGDKKAQDFKDKFVQNSNELNQKLDELINEKLDSLSQTTDSATFAKIKDAMSTLKTELADKLTTRLHDSSVFSKTAGDAVSKQQQFTADIVKTLDSIETAYANSKDVVEQVRATLASKIWPIEYLVKFDEISKQALAEAVAGQDPTTTLNKIISSETENEDDLNHKLINDGLWAFPDVKQNIWYSSTTNEAAALGIVQGTDNKDGFKHFNPEYKLNCAEGIAMMDKAFGLKPDQNVSTDVSALAGNVEWAKPFLQSMATEIGVDKLSSEITACGGIAGEMKRDIFANTAIAAYEKLTGKTLTVDPTTEIGKYTDFAQMNDQQKLDFAKAHFLGFITGANDGTSANFAGSANRAEAAKMLINLHKELAKLGLLRSPTAIPKG